MSQLAYYFQGLSINSPGLIVHNGNGIIKAIKTIESELKAIEMCQLVFNLPKRQVDMKLICIYYAMDNPLCYLVLAGSKSFWLLLKYIFTQIQVQCHWTTVFGMHLLHKQEIVERDMVVLEILVKLCKSKDIKLLQRNQKMIFKCNLDSHFEYYINKYTIEYMQYLELLHIHNTIEMNDKCIKMVSNHLTVLFTPTIKVLVNICANDESVSLKILEIIEFKQIFDKIHDKESLLILGLLNNILPYSWIPLLENQLPILINLYNTVKEDPDQDICQILLQLIFLWSVYYNYKSILNIEAIFNVNEALFGLRHTMQLSSNKGIEKLLTKFEN